MGNEEASAPGEVSRFSRIARQLEALAGAGFAWWVAGGWAVDLFLGRETRPHADFEIAIDRRDQGPARRHFAGWDCSKVVPGSGIEAWEEGETLRLPVHELHVSSGDLGIEVLLNEFENGVWRFRRHPAVTLPKGDFSIRAASGVGILAPQVVLLYKARSNRAADRLDLGSLLPGMTRQQRAWLRSSLAMAHPGHEWLGVV